MLDALHTGMAAPMDADAFGAWSATAEGRWELVGGLPLRLMSEGREHRRVKTALVASLARALPPGAPCRPEGDGALLRVPGTGDVLSPDEAIQCGDEVSGPWLAAPVAVFEIAVSSAARDLGEKRVAYLSVPSIVHVVVLLPLERRAVHFRRGVAEPRILSEGTLDLTPLGIGLDVAGFWARL